MLLWEKLQLALCCTIREREHGHILVGSWYKWTHLQCKQYTCNAGCRAFRKIYCCPSHQEMAWKSSSRQRNKGNRISSMFLGLAWVTDQVFGSLHPSFSIAFASSTTWWLSSYFFMIKAAVVFPKCSAACIAVILFTLRRCASAPAFSKNVTMLSPHILQQGAKLQLLRYKH